MWVSIILSIVLKLAEPLIALLLKRIFGNLATMHGDEKDATLEEVNAVVARIKKNGHSTPEDHRALAAILCRLSGKCDLN